MISVKLIAQTDKDVTTLSSHAAKTCYTSAIPELGQLIDVERRLFSPGHHTTLEHNHFTFSIEGLSVSSVVFGLHLNSPYYNSDQRSGRFSKMYQNPDLTETEDYLHHFYEKEDLSAALSFIQLGVQIYQEHINPLTTIAADVIRQDRPLASDKYIEQNAPKFAQEQLRMFISQVTPTALDITLNISAISALWRSAWSPELHEITNQMRDEVLQKQPDLAYMFLEEKRQNRGWSPRMNFQNIGLKTVPSCQLLSTDTNTPILPKAIDSVDILPFSPFAMDGNIITIKTEVEISCATMGQDQRHRSIHRSEPEMTGAFYLPPLLKMAHLEKTAESYLADYEKLAHKLSPALMTTIAPYGMMMRYQKKANLNALIHEQGKRLCWCAQEEISEVARQLRTQLKEKVPALAEQLAPPCYQSGCHEGVRFCGRQTNKSLVSDYFERRRV